MEDFFVIKAQQRDETGKKIAKQLRKQGRIPAIIYGDHKDPIPVSIDVKDVKAILKTVKGENTVLHIQRGDIEVNAMLKELQWDYLSDNIIHADLIRIDINKPVYVSIPVRIIGDSVGVRLEEGLFDFMTREIKIKALPAKIPTEFVVDCSEMHIGDSVKVGDLELEEGVQLVSDPTSVVCVIAKRGKAEEEDVEEEEGVEGEDGAEGEEGEDGAKESTDDAK